MRSTFKVLFYTKNQSIKNGRVPVMGRITINGTTASFSCKCDIPLSLWDAKGNCAKGKSEEARRLNRELENIKVRIGKHYQYICDHDTFVTAKKVYDCYTVLERRFIPWWKSSISRFRITGIRSEKPKPRVHTKVLYVKADVCNVI